MHVDTALNCKFLENGAHQTERRGLMVPLLATRRTESRIKCTYGVGQLLGVCPHPSVIGAGSCGQATFDIQQWAPSTAPPASHWQEQGHT